MKHLYIYKYDCYYIYGSHLHHTVIQTANPDYAPFYLRELYDVPEGNIVSITLLDKTLVF